MPNPTAAANTALYPERTPAAVDAIVAAARRDRAEAIARMTGAVATRCRLTLVSLLAPLFGWQRYQLPSGMAQHRLPRTT